MAAQNSAKKVVRKRRERKNVEKEIEQTESAIAIVESQMATPEGASDMNLYNKYQKLKQQLDRAMEEWDQASTELDELRNT